MKSYGWRYSFSLGDAEFLWSLSLTNEPPPPLHLPLKNNNNNNNNKLKSPLSKNIFNKI